MRATGRLVLIAAAVALSIAMSAPATASTAANETAPRPSQSTLVGQASLEWNCEDLTAADRQKAIREGVRMCGINEPAGGGATARRANTSNCGTAAIYVSQAGGRARVDYALHSTKGIITSRYLNVWWGPTYSGSKVDAGSWWGTAFSGSATNIGYAMNKKKFGAGMNGVVSILGWTIGCDVYASEPTRTL